MTPTLTLIVPNHNHKHNLPRLFDSILAQQYADLEVLVVDDCSDEPCEDAAEAYRSKGLDVRVLALPERSYTKNARIAGMRNARGRIIGFADADDALWGNEALAAHIAMFDARQADVLHFRSAFTDENGVFLRFFSLSDPFASQVEGSDVFTRWLTTDIYGNVLWNRLYSRDLCLSICDVAAQSKVLRYVEDIYLTALLLFNAQKYVGSERVGYGYHWVEKDRQDALERAVYSYYIRKEMLPYLKENGCSDDNAAAFAWALDNYIARYAGRLCLAIGREEGADISDATVRSLCETVDSVDLIKTLLVGGRVNAGKIVNTFRLLNGGSPL